VAFSSIVTVIISRRMRWVGIVARMGMSPKVWSESLKGRGLLEDLGVDGRIILKRRQKL
jgi:hypothetical protein